VDVRDTASRVLFTSATSRRVAGGHPRARGTPGIANLDNDADRLQASDYGFTVRLSSILNNASDGVHLGEPAGQPADIAAMIGGAESTNYYPREPRRRRGHGAGRRVSRRAPIAASRPNQPGCTGATIAPNVIDDNHGAGVELRSGFIIPLYVPLVIEHASDWSRMRSPTNGMGGAAGCTVRADRAADPGERARSA